MMTIKIRSFFIIATLFLFSLPIYAEPIDALFRQTNNPIAGNPHGKVTVIEFFDYQCSHCITMVPVVDAIIKANPDVRIVYKDFPIRGPMSDLAARVALAAKNQGKYVSVSHAILAENQPLTEESILDAAKSGGVDMNRLKKDMNSDSALKQIKANYDLAMELKIPGTPAFFIGKTNAKDMKDVKFVMGEMNQLEMQKAINDARQGM